MRTGPSRTWATTALGGVLAVVIGLAIAGMPGSAQQKGEWPAITGGDAATRYSALDQINASNFNNLKVLCSGWTFLLGTPVFRRIEHWPPDR